MLLRFLTFALLTSGFLCCETRNVDEALYASSLVFPIKIVVTESGYRISNFGSMYDGSITYGDESVEEGPIVESSTCRFVIKNMGVPICIPKKISNAQTSLSWVFGNFEFLGVERQLKFRQQTIDVWQIGIVRQGQNSSGLYYLYSQKYGLIEFPLPKQKVALEDFEDPYSIEHTPYVLQSEIGIK